MKRIIAILVILLISSTATGDTLAPEPLPWPKGLPGPARQADGAICLPKPLADATNRRLLHYNLYPRLCKNAIDEEAKLAAERSERNRWATWEIILTVTAGILGGLVVGGVAGFVVGGR